ncbi:MAG TPA: caspase family protein, partial [Reyranella sp.]|nr:caspase family protein [Reyranella sp.]
MADQLRVALVISNEEYASLPALERCGASATAARVALRGKGFKVIERGNLERGEFDSAIGALARRIAASPPALAVLYYCGYAMEFDGQSFLLPTSVTIARDDDVLTQGITSKSLVDSLGAAPQSTGFVLLDVFRTPNASAPTSLGRLIEEVTAANFAVIGAGNDGSGEGPTAASLALLDQVPDGDVNFDMFIVEMRRQLSRDTTVAAQFVPAIGGPSFPRAGLRESPPPVAPAASLAVSVPPPPAAPIATIPVVPIQPPPASAAPAVSTAVPVPPPPPPTEPAANASPPAPPPQRTTREPPQMSLQDKLLIQMMLADMGYYAGPIDGRFGRDTQGAIR